MPKSPEDAVRPEDVPHEETPQHIPQPMDSDPDQEHIKARAREIAIEFTSLYPDRFDYPEQIVRAGEDPDSYIFNGRRIVRNSLGVITQKLLETGEVQLETDDKDRDQVAETADLFRLRTDNPRYKNFVSALNDITAIYPRLFTASFLRKDGKATFMGEDK